MPRARPPGGPRRRQVLRPKVLNFDLIDGFPRFSAGLDRRHEGTGLGLPLVVALAELRGAVFKLDSKPGVGTKARVTFPSRRTIGAPVLEAPAVASAEAPENQSVA